MKTVISKLKKDTFLEIGWSVKNGMLSTWAKRNNTLSTRDLSGSVTINGEILYLSAAKIRSCREQAGKDGSQKCTVEFLFADRGIVWVWEITGKTDRLELTAVLKNNSKNGITAGEWNVLHSQKADGGIINLGAAPKQVRFFGWRPWDMKVERFAEAKSTHNSSVLCHLFDPSSQITFLSSFVTVDRMQIDHAVKYTDVSGITGFRATCSFGEYRIASGGELRSETLRISYHSDPYVALDSWADRVHDAYKPSFKGTEGVVWGGGAWLDSFTCKKDTISKILLGNAVAIREKLQGFGISSIWGATHDILKGGLPGNWLTFEKADGFKGGYRELFRKLRKMGFSFKFWFSPFWFFGEAEGILEENRENLLKDKNGELITRKTTWEFDRNYQPDDKPYLTMYYLDGTHPKTKRYLTKIFKAYREMGVRSYMLDFLSIKPEAKLYDATLLPVEACREILKVIRKAVGKDTHLQTAVASNPGFIGCVNSARVGRDYGEGRPMHPFHNWRNATYCMNDRHFSNKHAFVQNAAASWFTNRKIFVNDINFLSIDKPIPLEHARISTTMFGLCGDSPMGLGDDIRTIDTERLRMLKMCLPRTKGVPVPVDLFDNVAPESYCHILKKQISTKWDSYMIVAVFNTDGKQPYSAKFDFEKLGLGKKETFRIFEFWNEEYAGTYRESYSCIVPPNACRVYRISEARKHPWLLSTDMHIEQGASEIEALEWNEKSKTLKGVAVRPAGERGSIFFLIPRHLKLINHERTNIMKEVIDMQTVIRLPVDFKRDKEAFELRFEVMNTKFVSRNGWLSYATEDEWLKYVEENRDTENTRVIE